MFRCVLCRAPAILRQMAMEQFVLFMLMLMLMCCLSSRFADAYDPVDPHGNITINWDFQSIDPNVYTVVVSIHNYQLYRHIERPGWRLSWVWAGDEFISGVTGAETTEQGNCTGRHGAGGAPPHCCEKQPVMVDLPPGAPYTRQFANCCRGGVLSSVTQNNRTATSQFQMYIVNFALDEHGNPEMPSAFGFGVPGYTCSNATNVPATRSKVDEQRHEQVLLTWQIICSYSQIRDAPSPSCCVSLSAFYNSTIVGCRRCSCGCADSPSAPQCLSGGEQSKILAPPDAEGDPPAPAIRCTEHMCPIRVHWHVKQSYRGYWRVKATVTNYDVVTNYTDWNLVVRHPSLRSLTQLFSFNYQPLIQYGTINDTGMFWGIKNYNEALLGGGNVQTEMILGKDISDFTFSGGWAFPRRVYFDGHECVMPAPDEYPSLPNAAWDVRVSAVQRWLLAGSCLLSLSVLLLV